jgi:hypothetical protein
MDGIRHLHMKREPWHPADYDEYDVTAMQALARGDANDQQQQRALNWIVHAAAMANDQSFVPGQADVTSFLEGRRSVGNQIKKLINLDLAVLRQTTKGK